ncbi:MAG: aspartate carbamoyltransferase [Sorangiineae bacterium NIC37A_2]|nr:MAG: aspartate carbamoyltransferase [Sorangiineae bacterium NIC37A_2]
MSSPRHLLGIEGMTREEALSLLARAQTFLDERAGLDSKDRPLKGKTVLNVFFENSTRTRTSFELAGKRLGADVVNLAGSSSSTKKGETLFDTFATLNAMHAHAIVLRHSASGAPHVVAPRSRAAIVNAGDGMHEHPTQALLDALTLTRALGTLEGKTIAICGDILHSRVARSNALLLPLLGAKVRLSGPRTMLPRSAEALGLEVYDRIEPALEDVDAIMMLRIQMERLGGALFPSTREYSRIWGLNERRLRLARPGAPVLHPGPLNRGVEIHEDVADGTQSVILNQVEAGVAVRMAVLESCVLGS